ncbi:CopD family protein [Flavobacteriaceae bacterium]|nr:CopD family protein [Flavobacteriaceae bacterium]
MEYLYIKALHIIFVVTWFAGLFYIVRLFIYYKEADDKEIQVKSILQRQYLLMSKRLWYIITWPSAVLASIFGFYMLHLNPTWLTQGWMWVKLGFVAGLFIYHLSCQMILNRMSRQDHIPSSTFLRLWNEVATIILFAVVFLVVLKSAVNWIYGVVGIFGLGLLLMVLIKAYKKLRKRKSWDHTEES